MSAFDGAVYGGISYANTIPSDQTSIYRTTGNHTLNCDERKTDRIPVIPKIIAIDRE